MFLNEVKIHNQQKLKFSYVFSQFRLIWGWATWRRAWLEYDKNIKQWPQKKRDKWHHSVFSERELMYYYEDVWDEVYDGQVDTWDFQWLFAGFETGMLSVVPRCSLISNIGFTSSGTHTHIGNAKLANKKLYSLKFPLVHPSCIIRDTKYDERMEKRILFLLLPRARRIQSKLSNRHFYGKYIRKIPIVGNLWMTYQTKK